MNKPILTVAQISAIMNSAAPQYWGKEAIAELDLSNIADFGQLYENLSTGEKQSFQSGMVALITEQLFLTSEFVGDGIDIVKSFHTAGGNGGIIQKTRMWPADSIDDPSFDPAPNSTNDPYTNYGQEAETIYFSNKFAEMFAVSIPDNWYTGMFMSADKLMGLVAMIEGSVRTAVKVRTDLVTKETISARIAANIQKANPRQSINLLALFNERFEPTVPLTAAKALTDPEFGRFAALEMDNALDMLQDYNTLCNIQGFPSSTSKDDVHFLLNSQFVNSIHKYLYTDAYNLDYVKLPNFAKVFKWQGTGVAGDFESTSTIDVNIKVPWEVEPIKVNQSGVVGVCFNKDAVGIYDMREVTESKRDPMGLKTNYFTHLYGSTMVDPYEDFIVFFIAD